MRNTFVLMAAFMLLGFSGCATKAAPPPEKEGTVEPVGQKISAYYYAAYENSASVQEKLKAAGFDIVAVYAPTEESETIVITNAALKAAADKPGRGFAAILRVLVDEKNKRVSVTNPVYFGKAFLQTAYDHALGLALTEALKSALGELTASPDVIDYDILPRYHFMVGMPYYGDVYQLGEGDDAALLGKLDEFDKGKAVVFKLSIGEGRTLVGFDLGKRTKKFVKKIGTQNAEVLPYTILIADGKATALAAKYYIAISYPMLTMGEFMTIATVPGAVEKELEKPFK